MRANVVLFLLAGAAVLGLAAYLATSAPMPGGLSRPHARVVPPEACRVCHAEGGRTAGCLRCHGEIRAQLLAGTGWHGWRARQGEEACPACHGEHYGPRYALVNAVSWGGRDPALFRHEHVPFRLTGVHRTLACPACHDPLRAGLAWPAARARSFLGLTQECVACHPDVHGGTATGGCAACHDQRAFRPAPRFRHAAVFPLTGAHASLPCARCHRRYTEDHAFAVAGRSCKACHVSPHTAPNEVRYGSDCARCHTSVRFVPHRFRPADHPPRFPLLGAHAAVACRGCHRRSSPPLAAARPERCQDCHRNPHRPGGRAVPLAGAGDCGRCHRGGSWQLPGRVAALHRRAGFPLVGAHGRVACLACHRRDRPLPPPPRDCRTCHASPHRTALAGACRTCHGLADTAWAVARGRTTPAAHERAGFSLSPPHTGLACRQCHAPAGPYGERFPGRRREACGACHRDPHAGQFADRAGGCRACHALTRFLPPRYGPADHRTFPLRGAHLGVVCLQCHRRDEAGVRRFRGTPRACRACHTDPHRGRLTGPARGDCRRCHTEAARWRPVRFDHQRHTRFPLDGVHRRLACGRCHPRRQEGAGPPYVLYRPLGRTCRDCHVVR